MKQRFPRTGKSYRITMGALATAAVLLFSLAFTSGESHAQKRVGGKKGGAFVIDFMGVKSKGGKNICIIADRSGSMAAGTKYYDYATGQIKYGKKSSMDYLKEQLIGVMKQVTKNRRTKFHILLYSTNTIVQPVSDWAKKENVAKVMKWVKEAKPDGETNPMPAFQKAFQLNPLPDEIFFMSDGIFDDGAFGQKLYKLWKSSAANQKIKIHAIQLDVPGRDKASVMMSLWDQKIKSGEKRLIPANVTGAIENMKRIYQSKLKNKFAVAQINNQNNKQIALMRNIAIATKGQFQHIKKVK